MDRISVPLGSNEILNSYMNKVKHLFGTSDETKDDYI